MRIISQDGCYDIPYESIILQRLGTTIFGVTTGLQKSVTIARYRKEEKAIKSMKMCREQYAWCKIRDHGMNSLTMAMSFRRTDEIEQLLETFAEKNIFQFPEDEEVQI